MDETEILMHRLGVLFAAGLTQPGSLHEVVTENSRQGQTYDAAGNPALIGRWGQDLGDTAEQIRASERIHVLTVELSVDPAGNYMVACSGDLPTQTGAIASTPCVVFDADYRYPNHPLPGMVKPAGAVNDGRPTDPEILAEVQELVSEFATRFTRERKKPPAFRPGLTEADIVAAEQRLGVRLPEDLRALYRTIYDDSDESGLLAGYSLAPLAKVVAWYERGDPGSSVSSDGLFDYDPVVFETAPFGHVRRVSRNDWWITFAPDFGMNYAVVDLDPGPLGSYGQILKFGRDVYGPIQYVAPSIRHLLRQAIRTLPGTGFEETPSHPGYQSAEGYRWLTDVGSSSLPALLSSVDTDAIQRVHLRDAGQVNLADLAHLTNLRAIRILDVREKATYVNLALPFKAALEQLEIVADRFEPRCLSTQLSLTYLTLAGNAEPVNVADLAALPNLIKLDLAGASIADLSSLNTFPALRVLTLNAHQWNELLSSGWKSDTLAAAELGAKPGIVDSATWLASTNPSRQPAPRYRVVHGRR